MNVFGLGELPRAGRAPRSAKATPRQQQANEARRAAAMLEGLFMRQLMRIMRKSVPESSLLGKSSAMGIYNEMFDGALVDGVTGGRTGFGLREDLMRQLQGGAQPALASPASASRAAAAFQRMASMGISGIAGIKGGEAAADKGLDLNGVGFEAPARPDGRQLSDADGRLVSPRAGSDVLAAGSGRVVSADAHSMVLDHGDGLRTSYRGLRVVEAQAGDLVLRGQTLGSVGQGGLEYSVNKNGRRLQTSEIQGLLKEEKHD